MTFVVKDMAIEAFCEGRNLVKRDELEKIRSIHELLDQAKHRAQEIIAEAEGQAQTLLELAEEDAKSKTSLWQAQFEQEAWLQAEQVFNDIQSQVNLIWDTLERHASEVVNSVIDDVLEGIPEKDRALLLTKKVIAQQKEMELARIHCSADCVEEIGHWLDEMGYEHISTKADPQLAKNQVKLVTDNGEFGTSWEKVTARSYLP